MSREKLNEIRITRNETRGGNLLLSTVSACAQFTPQAHLGNIKQSQTELVLSFYCSCFSVSLLFCPC